MLEVSIQTDHLKAAALAAAQQDIRYYLNGVLCEVRATETRLVATDGNLIAVLRDTVSEGAQPVFPDVIIPNETIKQVLVNKCKAVALKHDPVSKAWSLGGVTFTPVGGQYPAYRRVLTTTHSGVAAQFNVDLLMVFRKISKALGVKGQPIVRHNGEGGAQVQFYNRNDEFVGIIMPLRAFTEKEPDPGLVRWGPEQAK